MKTIYFLKGLPASGKSQWAKEKMAQLPVGSVKRVNKDLLREMLDCGKWTKKNEEFIIKVRDILVAHALMDGKHVIVDDTNLHPKHLGNIDNIAKDFGAKIEVIDFTHVTVDECIKRDQKRPNYVGEKVIKKMYNQFLAKPTPRLDTDSKLPDAYVVDLDGTLALHNNRSPYDCHLCETDTANRAIMNIIHSVVEHIILVSGRPDDVRPHTIRWLEANNVDYTHLFMRRAGDLRPDDIVKREIYENEIMGKYRVIGWFDDRLRVARMVHSLGLPLFRVGDPDLDF